MGRRGRERSGPPSSGCSARGLQRLPSEQMMDEKQLNELERENRLIELVKLDYEVALRAINGFVATSAQVRAVGVAAWGVIFGLSLDGRSSALAVLSLCLLVIFAYTDAYHAALYRRALSRAIGLEGLLDGYADRLGIDAEDEDAVIELQSKVEVHRFGMYRTPRHPQLDDMLKGRPRVVFVAMYPALMVASLVATVWFW